MLPKIVVSIPLRSPKIFGLSHWHLNWPRASPTFFGPDPLKLTKIGHWPKMKYTKLMIPTGLVAIHLAFIYPRHNPECPGHPPDTSQTPSRHPTDTPIYATFWPIRGNREKRKKKMKMSLIRCLSIACISYPPRQYPESLRHLPDTLRTPQIRHIFLPIQGN